MARFDIATVGDNCIDRYLPLGVSAVGGNAVNVAVHLARLGHAVAYFGAVGEDEAGHRTLAVLRENGVVLDHARMVPGRTAYTDLDVDAAGERIIAFEEFGVCAAYRPSADEAALLASMRHVHIGWLDDGGALRRTLVGAGVSLSQDLAVHPGAAGVGMAFGSVGADPGKAERQLAAMLAEGARLAIVTMGPLGSMASDGAERFQTGIAPAQVVDTTGAGDTFIAHFIAARLSRRSLPSALEAGRDGAARTCEHVGGFPQAPLPLGAGA